MKSFASTDLFLHRHLESLHGETKHDACVFVQSHADEQKDCYTYFAWLLQPHSRKSPLRLSCGPDLRSAKIDPQGKLLAFVDKPEQEEHAQVYLLPIHESERRELTRYKDEISSIEMWSGDGAKLLVIIKVPWSEDDDDDVQACKSSRPQVVRFLPYKTDGSGTHTGYRAQLQEIDATNGQEKTLLQGDFDVKEAQWSPDGSRLAWVSTGSGVQRHRSELWIADAKGNNPQRFAASLQSISGIRWSQDGQRLAFGGSKLEGDSLSHLWVCTVENGQISQPGGDDLQLEGDKIIWHPDGRRIATIAVRGCLHQVVVVDLQDESVSALLADFYHANSLSVCGDRLVFAASSIRDAVEVYSMQWDGSDQRRHTEFNCEWFSQRARPRVSVRTFDVPVGERVYESASEVTHEPVEAWLMLPAHGEGPFPLLVDLHGGPQSIAMVDYSSHVYRYELLSKGWAILAPNLIGSGGYGARFARRLCGHWGEYDFPQLLAILDTLQEEGLADERLACTGKSYGGYLTAWAIGQSDRFKAAVISAPVANIESHAGTSDSGYYVTPYAMRGELAEVRKRYRELSPTQHCYRARTASLLLQGKDDQRCPLGQSEEIFANLVRYSDAPSQMILYPGGSHAMAATGKPSHRVDYHRRLAAWVEHYAGKSTEQADRQASGQGNRDAGDAQTAEA